MGAVTPSDRGFIADMRLSRALWRRRPRGRAVIVILVLILSGALAFLLIPKGEIFGSANGETVPHSISNNCYELKVYALNQTSKQKRTDGTYFAFNVADLPFSVGSLEFGDFRADTSYTRNYYGGSGVLVVASGKNTSVTLKESTGKEIGRIWYHGQSPLVLSGETRYCSYTGGVTWNGTDMMIQDWKAGTWTPGDGIFVAHPKNVTLTSAVFYIMVFEPAYNAEIPEYEFLPAVIMILGIVLFARKSRAGRGAR